MAMITPRAPESAAAAQTAASPWRMTLGAQLEPGGVRFRVWAPKRARVDVVLEEDGRSFPLTKDERGYFSGRWRNFQAGGTGATTAWISLPRPIPMAIMRR